MALTDDCMGLGGSDAQRVVIYLGDNLVVSSACVKRYIVKTQREVHK